MDRKILIVDDEADILKYIGTLLEDHDYSAITTMDPFDAVDLAVKESPGLICLDIMMPKKSGLSLYKEIRTEDKLKDIPVIIISAFTSNSYGSEGINIRKFITDPDIKEPDAYFEKPLNVEKFIEFVNSVFKVT